MTPTERPRVLVLTTTFPARPGDGTPAFVLDLARSLAADFDVHVVTPRVPGASRREVVDGVSVERFAYFPRRWERIADGATLPNLRAQPWRFPEFCCLLARFQWCAWRARRRLRPDVVHAHWLLPAGLVAATAAGRAPIVVTVHGVDVHALPVAPIELLRRLALRRASRVATVSTPLADRVRGLRADADVRVVPMGVDLAEIAAATSPRQPSDGLVGFVGRLAEKKGVDVLVRALVELSEVRLVIAGDGPERAALERIARELGVSDRVHFAGHATRAQVLELLRTSELLAVPSVVARDGDQEGTPVVVAEAVAAAVPLVASRIGGIAEHLDESTAWLVEPGDAGALAHAVAAAHRDGDERTRRADEALRRVAPRLSIDTTATVYGRIYREVLNVTQTAVVHEPLRPGTHYRTELLRRLGVVETAGLTVDVGGRDGRLLAALGAGAGVLVDMEVAPREQTVMYVRGSGLSLPVADARADTVVALDVIEHVADEERFVAELVRIVRPGGQIVLTTPSDDIRVLPGPLQRLIDRSWGHDRVRGYGVDHLRQLFVDAGATDVEITSVGMRAYRWTYVPMRVLWSVSNGVARRAVSAAAGWDRAHLRGERGFRLLIARG